MNYSIALLIFFTITACAMEKDEYTNTLSYRKKYDVLSPDVHEPVAPRVAFPECSICLEMVDRMNLAPCIMQCGHIFHFDCIDEWTKTNATCPLCRANDQISVRAAESRMAVVQNQRREVVNILVTHAVSQFADILCIPTGLRRRVVPENYE